MKPHGSAPAKTAASSKVTDKPANGYNNRARRHVPDPLAIWRFADEAASNLTKEDLAQIPHDGARNYEHYLYGLSKEPK